MGAEQKIVDTNILLEATDESRAHHQVALELLSNGLGLHLCAQVVREYLVVATRPAGRPSNGLGLSMRDAVENMGAFRERIRLLPEEKPLLPALLALLAEVPYAGKRIHDAHLVACAVVHGVRILVTLNGADFKGFSRYVTAVEPGEKLKA